MKRLLLPLLAALALPIAIQADDRFTFIENKFPIGEWIPWVVDGDDFKFKFLGCKRGFCQTKLRSTEANFREHTTYDCKNFRTIDSLPVVIKKEKDYQEYVWKYPVIGSFGDEMFEKVCSHKGGDDFKN